MFPTSYSNLLITTYILLYINPLACADFEFIVCILSISGLPR